MADSERKIARIVPRSESGDGPMMAHGTEVWIGDQRMKGITRIELVCEAGDFWRARIDCHVQVTDLLAEAAFHRPTWWERFKAWMADSPATGGGPR